MCRPPEPCISAPPSGYARWHDPAKLGRAAGYGGGYECQTYNFISPDGGGSVAAGGAVYENLGYEHSGNHRHVDGYHGRRQQLSLPLPMCSNPTNELMGILARRGVHDWDTFFSSSLCQASLSSATPTVVADVSTTPNNDGLARDGGGVYAFERSVACGDCGGVDARANARCPTPDTPIGAVSGAAGSHLAIVLAAGGGGALAAEKDKSRKRASSLMFSSSSILSHTPLSRPVYAPPTTRSPRVPSSAANDAGKGTSASGLGHAALVACLGNMDDRAHYMSCAGEVVIEHDRQYRCRLVTATAAMPAILSVSDCQTATSPVGSTVHVRVGASAAASPRMSSSGGLEGITRQEAAVGNKDAPLEVGSSVADIDGTSGGTAVLGLPGISLPSSTSSSAAVVVGNFMPSPELERGWTSAPSATQRDLDKWIEEIVTCDPLPESVMGSLDCDFSSKDIVTPCEAEVVVPVALPTAAAAKVPMTAGTGSTTTNPVPMENVDRLLVEIVSGGSAGPVGGVSTPVSAAVGEGAGGGIGDNLDDPMGKMGSCSRGLWPKTQEEEGHYSDSPWESLTDEEKKADSSLTDRPTSQLAGLPDKKTKRMLSNRESARRSRQRRQELMDTLELEAARLRVENAALVRRARETAKTLEECKQQNNSLNEELKSLRGKLCFYEPPNVTGVCMIDGGSDFGGGGVRFLQRAQGEEEATCVVKDGSGGDMEGNEGEEQSNQEERCVKKAKRNSACGYDPLGVEEDCLNMGEEGNEDSSRVPTKSSDSAALSGGGSAVTSSQLLSPFSSGDEEEGRMAACYTRWFRCDQISDVVDTRENNGESAFGIEQDMKVKEPHIWTRTEGGGLSVVRAH